MVETQLCKLRGTSDIYTNYRYIEDNVPGTQHSSYAPRAVSLIAQLASTTNSLLEATADVYRYRYS